MVEDIKNILRDKLHVKYKFFNYLLIICYVYHKIDKYILDTYMRIQDKYTHFIYFPIEFKSVDDGVRSINEDWRTEIDNQFKSVLLATGRDYLTVTGSPNQRVEQILNYIK